MRAILIRNGQKVWPTCPNCGCRLQELSRGWLFHFLDEFSDKDARGCDCAYMDFVWDNDGKVIWC